MKRLSNVLVALSVTTMMMVPVCGISEFFGGDLEKGAVAVVLSLVLMLVAGYLDIFFGKKK